MKYPLILAVILVLFPTSQASAVEQTTYPIVLTDAIGRSVTVAKEPKAVMLGTGFNLVALSLIHPDPVSILSAWAGDMKSDNPEIYDAFRAKFPVIEALPIIGDGRTLTTEAALSVKSDLVLLAQWQARSEIGQQTIKNLDALSIPVLVVNFDQDALNQTASNMRLLGDALNRKEQAYAYADFYEQRLQDLQELALRVPAQKKRVLLTAFPDVQNCCFAYGTGGLGAFVDLVGGFNVAETLPSHGGLLTPEAVLASAPDVLIATSSPGGTYATLSIGPGIEEEEARKTLKEMLKNPFLAASPAIKAGKAYGLWNFFNAVPINILAAESFAKWTYPEIYRDIDPKKTLEEINTQFSAVPFKGAYWVELGGAE